MNETCLETIMADGSEVGKDLRFQNKRDATATNTEHEQWATPCPVHHQSTKNIAEDADGDPAALENELIFCVVA